MTSPPRSSTACSSEVACCSSTALRCARSTSALTRPRTLRQGLIRSPEFPESRRQSFRNPQSLADLGTRTVVLDGAAWTTMVQFLVHLVHFGSGSASAGRIPGTCRRGAPAAERRDAGRAEPAVQRKDGVMKKIQRSRFQLRGETIRSLSGHAELQNILGGVSRTQCGTGGVGCTTVTGSGGVTCNSADSNCTSGNFSCAGGQNCTGLTANC